MTVDEQRKILARSKRLQHSFARSIRLAWADCHKLQRLFREVPSGVGVPILREFRDALEDATKLAQLLPHQERRPPPAPDPVRRRFGEMVRNARAHAVPIEGDDVSEPTA